MNTKKMLQTACVFAILISFSILTSCSKDDDIPNDPTGTVTLNMLDERNGKTFLGVSDVYINKANNFHSSSSLLTDIGSAAGLGSQKAPVLNNLVREAAVQPGHIYQVFDYEAVREFPSGIRAVAVGAAYYQAYAVSPIQSETDRIGTVVKYVSVYPDSQGLPEYGYKFGEVNYAGDYVFFTLPKDSECFWYSGIPEVFDIQVRDGELVMQLNRTPTGYNGVSGNYSIYIRKGNVYTAIVVRVN